MTRMRVRSRAQKLIAFAIGALGLVACLTTDTGPEPDPSELPYLGPRSDCSTGPAYAWDTTFPQGPKESSQPECIPRCGEHPTLDWGSSGGAGGPSPTIDAVPSGACAYEDEACSMVAVKRCCGPDGDNGQAFVFECRCRAKTWVCVAAFHGGDVCACGGGEDAAVDTPDGGTSDDASFGLDASSDADGS